jgi:hypothetical protein
VESVVQRMGMEGLSVGWVIQDEEGRIAASSKQEDERAELIFGLQLLALQVGWFLALAAVVAWLTSFLLPGVPLVAVVVLVLAAPLAGLAFGWTATALTRDTLEQSDWFFYLQWLGVPGSWVVLGMVLMSLLQPQT